MEEFDDSLDFDALFSQIGEEFEDNPFSLNEITAADLKYRPIHQKHWC